MNDKIKKMGFGREIGPSGSRLLMRTSALCKHGKCDVKRIDREEGSKYLDLRHANDDRTGDCERLHDWE